MEWGFVVNISPSFRHADITLVDNMLRSYRRRTGSDILSVSDILCYRKVQCFTRLCVNVEGRRVVVCESGNAATRAALPPAPPTSPPPQSPRSPAPPRTPPLPVSPSLSLRISSYSRRHHGFSQASDKSLLQVQGTFLHNVVIIFMYVIVIIVLRIPTNSNKFPF